MFLKLFEEKNAYVVFFSIIPCVNQFIKIIWMFGLWILVVFSLS